MNNFLTKHSFDSQKVTTFATMKCRLIPDVSFQKNQFLAMIPQNLLTLNNSGEGVARLIYHSTYLHTSCSDATQGHLTDVSCPVNKNHTIQFPK